jgi:hypothetical protein
MMQIPEIACTRKTGLVQSIKTASAGVLHTRARFNGVQELVEDLVASPAARRTMGGAPAEKVEAAHR